MAQNQRGSIFNDIQFKKDSIINIAETYGASNVRIFGSVARGEDMITVISIF